MEDINTFKGTSTIWIISLIQINEMWVDLIVFFFVLFCGSSFPAVVSHYISWMPLCNLFMCVINFDLYYFSLLCKDNNLYIIAIVWNFNVVTKHVIFTSVMNKIPFHGMNTSVMMTSTTSTSRKKQRYGSHQYLVSEFNVSGHQLRFGYHKEYFYFR